MRKFVQICLVSRVSDVAHWPLVHACILRMKVKIAIPGQISYLSIERQLNYSDAQSHTGNMGHGPYQSPDQSFPTINMFD